MTYKDRFQFTHAGEWLNTLLSQFPDYDKGQLYVDRFCEACDSLKQKGVIRDFTVWEKHSKMDNSGVDVTIDMGNSFVDFSVTSSFANAQAHIETNQRHPERGIIRIVYVREGNRPVLKSVENLEREILRKSQLSFRKV